MPNLVAYDLAGVQPMNGPTGLIFAMRSRYANQSGAEALFNEADTSFASQNDSGNLTNGFTGGSVGFGTTGGTGLTNASNPAALNPEGSQGATTYPVGQGMRTDDAEALGDGSGNHFNEMAFSIEKVTVTAKSRALKAEYSLELAQDLKAIHGLNAEAELANILSTEILAEINREVIRTIYKVAESGAQVNTATAGAFDLDVDSNGRWSVEKFKGLIFQIERDANRIAQRTRRGKGNMILCSADVASALTMAGVLDYTPALNANLNVDDTGNTFAGVLNGKYRVYIDPYSANSAADPVLCCRLQRFFTLRRRSVLLPIRSSPNGSRRWSGHLPTKNWIQDSLRYRCKPILTGNHHDHLTWSYRELQPLLPARQGSKPHVIHRIHNLTKRTFGSSFFMTINRIKRL